MSEQQQQPEQEAPTKSKASTVRLIVMLAILVILGGAMGYDFLVARPAHEKAVQAVDELIKQNKTMADVHSTLDREPNETRKVQDLVIEKYSWRSGLLVTTHSIYVVYKQKMIESYDTKAPESWADAAAAE